MINIKIIVIFIITCLMLSGCGAPKEKCHNKCLISNFEEKIYFK